MCLGLGIVCVQQISKYHLYYYRNTEIECGRMRNIGRFFVSCFSALAFSPSFLHAFFSLQFRYSDSNANLYVSTPVEMTVRNIYFNVWRMASRNRFGLLFKCAHTILRKSQSLKSHNITISFNMVFWRYK